MELLNFCTNEGQMCALSDSGTGSKECVKELWSTLMYFYKGKKKGGRERNKPHRKAMTPERSVLNSCIIKIKGQTFPTHGKSCALLLSATSSFKFIDINRDR